MTTRRQQPASSISDDVFEQASNWFLQLQGTTDEALLSEFKGWLETSPIHEEAYLEVLMLWQELDETVAETEPETIFDIEPADIKSHKNTLLSNIKVNNIKSFMQYTSLAACILLMVFIVPQHVWQPADYATATAQQRTIILDDGSKIHLSAQSAVNVDYSAKSRNIELLYGEAFFEVTGDPQRPFKVGSGDQTAQAIGTAFNIRQLNQQVQTTLTEGVLKLDFKKQGTLLINAGQRVDWNGRGHQLSDGDYAYLPSWKRHIVRLDKMPLKDAVKLLNRYYTPIFRIADPGLGEKTLQGTLPLNNLDTAMKVLQGALNLEYVTVSDKLILLY